MVHDAHGLDVTAASSAAVEAFGHMLMGYLRYRVDKPGTWLQCSALPIAEAAAADAARFSGHTTWRKRAHVIALQV